MSRLIFKALAGFCIAALLLVAIVVALTLSHPAPPLPALPNPNGYDDFVAAGNMLADTNFDLSTMTTNELRDFVVQHTNALALARRGLTRECRVPLLYSPTNTVYFEGLGAVKRVAQGLVAQGKVAESENRMDDALDAYLTAIRAGQESDRGGLIINSLVSIAMESMGIVRIEATLTNLSAKQCRELVSALESAESRRVPAAAILAQEHQWVRRTFGLKGQIQLLFTIKNTRRTERSWMSRVAAQQVRTQTLLVKLASRAYELEKGKAPPQPADLVPEYLKGLPASFNAATNSSRPP